MIATEDYVESRSTARNVVCLLDGLVADAFDLELSHWTDCHLRFARPAYPCAAVERDFFLEISVGGF